MPVFNPAQGGASVPATSNVIKGNGSGGAVAATPGTDYLLPNGSGAALTGITASQAGAATSAQGAKADSALQPNGSGASLTGITASQVGADASGAATAAQNFAIQRANHTGTQTLSTISDAGTAAANNTGDFSAFGALFPASIGDTIQPTLVSTSTNYAATITPAVGTTGATILLRIITALSGNITIANPTGTPKDGQILRVSMVQDATGGRTVSLGANYDAAAILAAVPSAANARFTLYFTYRATDGKWEGASIVGGAIPAYALDLTDTAVSAATATLVAGQNSQVTGAGPYTAPAVASTVTVPPQRFGITNRTTSSVTLSMPNPSGTTLTLTILPGEATSFRQVSTSGYVNEPSNKPLAQLDARYVQPNTAPALTGTNITGIPEAGVTNLTTDLANKASLTATTNTFTGTLKAAGFLSSDGTSGATNTTAGAIFKNGLYTGGTITGGSGTTVTTDGWTAETSTWTYASATAASATAPATQTFTVPADVTTYLSVGDKLKLTQAALAYFYVVAISVSGGTSTVTVTGGSDYALTNAAITSPMYSHTNNPVGFPAAFNFATFYPSGVSTAPSGGSSVFWMTGGYGWASVNPTTTGTASGGNITLTLPITAGAFTNAIQPVVVQNSSNLIAAVSISSGSTTATIYGSGTLGGFTGGNAAAMRAQFSWRVK